MGDARRGKKYRETQFLLKFHKLLPRGFVKRLRKRLDRYGPRIAAAHGTPPSRPVRLSQRACKGTRIRAIAFYLPQFHPIPENDAWWGRGFTEWTNVSKAVPQFVGHDQPRLPGELGFYDLRLVEVQRRQAELARHYGIYGFCYYYYWFSGGKRLLERPLNQVLENKDLDQPFCVCWANENWTRRWDGSEHEILMEQRYDPQDDLAFIEDLLPVLKDPRYIRIGGRPLIAVYRVSLLAAPQKTAQVWRDYCRSHGVGDPFLAAVQSFKIGDPRPFGFDAAIEFPPHDIPAREVDGLELLNPDYRGKVYDYDYSAEQIQKRDWPDYEWFRTVFPSWDNAARRPGGGQTYFGGTPQSYARWLERVCAATDAHHTDPETKLVFINAWNEWAEGAHLEPDRRTGYGYLEATRHVLEHYPPVPRTQPRLVVIVHAFYLDVLGDVLRAVQRVGSVSELVVTCSPQKVADVRKMVESFELSCPVRYVIVENRGRDIFPFLKALDVLELGDDDVILKLHTKKSTHLESGMLWGGQMLSSLGACAHALAAFAAREDLGLVAPEGCIISAPAYLGGNAAHLEALLRRLGWSEVRSDDVFSAGSMFYARYKYLRPFLSLALDTEDFEPEEGQIDGTLAHAIERAIGIGVARAGARIVDVCGLADGGVSAPNENFAFARKAAQSR